MDRAAERERGVDRVVDRAAVQDRKGAGQTETDRADVRVRRRAERSAAAAEDFRLRLQLRVDFQSDNGLERRLWRILHTHLRAKRCWSRVLARYCVGKLQ